MQYGRTAMPRVQRPLRRRCFQKVEFGGNLNIFVCQDFELTLN